MAIYTRSNSDQRLNTHQIEAKRIRVAFVIPNHYWSGSVALPADTLQGINLMTEQESLLDAPRFELHYLFDPEVPPQGMTQCYFDLTPIPRANETTPVTDAFDMVIVPAIWTITPFELKRYGVLMDWLNRQNKLGAHFVCVTNGAYFLAEAGLLSGHAVSIHWAFKDLFHSLYPDVLIREDLTGYYEGRCWSSSGITPTLEMMQRIITRYCGQALASACAKYFMLNNALTPEPLTTHVDANEPIIRAICDWLKQNFQHALTIQQVAQQFHMSVRNLNRRFSAETGKTPHAYLQELRLDRGAKLLASTHTHVETIALQCGYQSGNAFGKAFKQTTGQSPLNYRRTMTRAHSS